MPDVDEPDTVFRIGQAMRWYPDEWEDPCEFPWLRTEEGAG